MEVKLVTSDQLSKAGIDSLKQRKGNQAVFDQIMSLRAGIRSGSASAKTRAEVKGSSKKPWKQKGTGRARFKDRKSTVWRGGGVVHGPKPRSYALKVNKKVKKLALQRAILERINDGDILSTKKFEVSDGKTKTFMTEINSLINLKTVKKVLILSEEADEKTLRSSKNVPNIKMFSPKRVNVEQLLYFDKILLVNDALDHIVARVKK